MMLFQRSYQTEANMEISEDYFTDSGSRNYITIEIQMMQGRTLFLIKDDYEGDNLNDYDPQNLLLDRFLSMDSIEELLAFLELEPSDFSGDITQYAFQDICWISIGYNRMLFNEDIDLEDETLVSLIKENITNFYMDLNEDEKRDLYPDGIDWDQEISEYCKDVLVLEGTVTYFLTDRTVSRDLSLDSL